MSDQSIVNPALSSMEPLVFTAPRKKFAVAGLIFIGIALVELAAGIFLAVWAGDSAIFLFALVFAVVFGVVGGMTVVVSFEPPQLQIDASGLTMSARGRQQRILWSQVEEIRLIRLSSLAGRTLAGRRLINRVPADRRSVDRDQFWLVAWLHAGVPSPM